MSDFSPGFAMRHHAAGEALQRAFSPPPDDFAERSIAPSAPPRQGRPKSYSPADPEANPTEGWDPFDSTAKPTEFFDPAAAAHAAGFAEGQAAARAEISAGAAERTAFAEQLTAALAQGAQFDRDTFARQLRQTVVALVARVVGEVGIDADLLEARVKAAVELLADTAESAILRVHPDTVALLEGRLPKSLFAVGDASLAPGAFVIESGSTIVEDGPDLWLEQLVQAIERVPLPPQC